MLDQRSYTLLKEITSHHNITKSEVVRKLDLSNRQFAYDLERANTFLGNVDLPKIQYKQNALLVPEELYGITISGLLYDVNLTSFILSEQDRVFAIYLYNFIRQESVSNYHYQVLLGVSRNTALSDVRQVKLLCETWDLKWSYSRTDGYHVIGNEMDKRRLASYCCDMLYSQPLGKEIMLAILKSWNVENEIVQTKEIVERVLSHYNIEQVKNRKNEMIFRLTFFKVRGTHNEILFKIYEKNVIGLQKIFEAGSILAQELFVDDLIEEQYFVTLQLLVSLQEVDAKENPSLNQLAERIIAEFEKVTLLPIENRDYLQKSLYNHLVPAFFRISFRIPLINPLKSRIKEEYQHLFEFVQQSLEPLSMWTGQKISEEEVGLFTLHFGGYLTQNNKKITRKLRGLIVCSNGISSSLMLKAQLSLLFTEIDFMSTHSLRDINNISPKSYDMIFSTVDGHARGKPFYVVKPFLTQVEKNYLTQQVVKDFPEINVKDISVDRLMEVIRKYADIHEEEALFSELVNFLYLNNQKQGRFSPMLSELITEDMIQITDEALGWKEAITEASRPLLKSEKIEQDYIDAMIDNVVEMGAYIHVGKGIAIPHARPESGVNQIGMSFLRTKEPVLLLDKEEHAIDIFIVIAAIDNEAHLKALSSLTKILADDQKLTELKNADSKEKIIELIKEGEDEK